MRDAGLAPVPLAQSNARDLYWTVAQMVAHHASNGCNLKPRRPVRQRHHLRRGTVQLRLPAGNLASRPARGHPAERRNPPLSGRRRRDRPARPGQRAGLRVHRLRRMPRSHRTGPRLEPSVSGSGRPRANPAPPRTVREGPAASVILVAVTLRYFRCRSHSAKIFAHVVSDASVSYTARSGKQKP